jgi:hypothetical protein
MENLELKAKIRALEENKEQNTKYEVYPLIFNLIGKKSFKINFILFRLLRLK